MPDEEKKEKKRKESKHKTNKFVAVWQDREIRFDTPTAHLQNRKGEAVIDSINSVEDTKGNNGERGSLGVTNCGSRHENNASEQSNAGDINTGAAIRG